MDKKPLEDNYQIEISDMLDAEEEYEEINDEVLEKYDVWTIYDYSNIDLSLSIIKINN